MHDTFYIHLPIPIKYLQLLNNLVFPKCLNFLINDNIYEYPLIIYFFHIDVTKGNIYWVVSNQF